MINARTLTRTRVTSNVGYLQDKLEARGSKVKSLVAHPGAAITDLRANTAASGEGHGMDNRVLGFLANNLSQSAADGSLPLLACSVEPEAKSGDFYVPGHASLGSMIIKVRSW